MAAVQPVPTAGRDTAWQAATATTTAERIRDLTPARRRLQVIVSTSGTTQAVTIFAVTLIPQGTGLGRLGHRARQRRNS